MVVGVGFFSFKKETILAIFGCIFFPKDVKLTLLIFFLFV